MRYARRSRGALRLLATRPRSSGSRTRRSGSAPAAMPARSSGGASSKTTPTRSSRRYAGRTPSCSARPSRSVEQNNASLFCLGSSFHDQCGFALASGGKDIITLSYWENGTPHADLISANVPLSSEKYHAYAIRAKGKTVELFVDGVKAGTARLNAIPQYGLQFMGVTWGSNNTGLGMPVGARIDDWRFCNSAISDASIEAYADILAKYDEYPAFVRVEKFYVPYYRLHRHYPSSTNYDALAGQASASSTAIWKCFAAGTAPIYPDDIFKAMIEFKDNAPYITWTPNLNTNGVKRKYTIWDAANLVDNVWHSPTNSSDCLFKVAVDMP